MTAATPKAACSDGQNTARVSAGGSQGIGEGYQLVGGEKGQNTLILFAQEVGPGAGEGNIAGKARNFQDVEFVSGLWMADSEAMGTRSTVIRHSAVVLLDHLVLRLGQRLGGNGTLRGDVSNQGTVAPGESIGTLTIDGNYTHGASGVLEVETRADGQADKLVVTGKVTLQGGTVQVLPEEDVRDYRGKTVQYSILEAGAGIEGQFAQVVTPSLFLRSGLSYQDGAAGGKTVVLELKGMAYADLARTPNEKSVAQILDDLYDRDRSAGLVRALESYGTSSESAFRAGLNSMSGEIYTAFPVASVATIDRFAQAVLRGMDDPEAQDGRRGWVESYDTWGKLKGTGDNAGADVKVAGGAAGIHVLTGSNGRVGVTAGFAHSNVNMNERKSSMTGDGYQLGVYGRYDLGALRMTGLFVHSRTRYDAQRRVAVGVGADRFHRTAHGKFDGTQLLASLRGEWLNRTEGATVVQPVLGLSWLRTSRNGFGEKGADDANLRVESYAASWVRGDIGLRVVMRPVETRGGWRLNSVLRVAYVHDFSAPSRDVQVRMAANPGESRTIHGIEHAKDGFQVGLGLSGFHRDDDRFSWNLQYEGEFRSDVQTHAVHAGLSYRF